MESCITSELQRYYKVFLHICTYIGNIGSKLGLFTRSIPTSSCMYELLNSDETKIRSKIKLRCTVVTVLSTTRALASNRTCATVFISPTARKKILSILLDSFDEVHDCWLSLICWLCTMLTVMSRYLF